MYQFSFRKLFVKVNIVFNTLFRIFSYLGCIYTGVKKIAMEILTCQCLLRCTRDLEIAQHCTLRTMHYAPPSLRLLSGPRQCTTLVELNVRKCCRNVSQMTHLLHLFCNRCTKHATITQKNFVCNRLCPLPLAMPGI